MSEQYWQGSLRKEGRGELPWWEVLIIKNKGTGPSSVVFRMEHFIADGLSLITLFEKFVTRADGTPITSSVPMKMSNKFRRNENTFATIPKFLKSMIKVLTLPSSKFDHKVFFRKGIGRHMVHTGKRKCILFHNVPLEFIKELKNAAEVTVNDIILTALSQAIHDYCVKHDDPVLQKKGKRVRFRALMPVAFPRSDKDKSDPSRAMRNRWFFISSDIGLGWSNVVDRLKYIKRKMDSLKQSPAIFSNLIMQSKIPPLLPLKLARQTVFDVFCRHSMAFTNVPGPGELCIFAGKEVYGLHFIYNNLLPQVAVLTYNGSVFMNMVLDHEALPDCDVIPILFSKALVDLAYEMKVSVPLDVLEHSRKETTVK